MATSTRHRINKIRRKPVKKLESIPSVALNVGCLSVILFQNASPSIEDRPDEIQCEMWEWRWAGKKPDRFMQGKSTCLNGWDAGWDAVIDKWSGTEVAFPGITATIPPLMKEVHESQTGRIILIRHGRTAWNDEGRIQGQQDVDLDSLGLSQALSLKPVVDRYCPDVVYSSDLIRASRTAQLATGLPLDQLQLEPGLRERCFGALETHTRESIRQKWDPHFFADECGEPEMNVEGMERYEDFQRRVVQTIVGIAAQHSVGTVCLFTHGGVIRAWMGHLFQIDGSTPRRFRVSNASLFEFEADPVLGWVLVQMLNTPHIIAQAP